jgi:hypothetical protein
MVGKLSSTTRFPCRVEGLTPHGLTTGFLNQAADA